MYLVVCQGHLCRMERRKSESMRARRYTLRSTIAPLIESDRTKKNTYSYVPFFVLEGRKERIGERR